jgi:cyanophycinase-like exopeptidase
VDEKTSIWIRPDRTFEVLGEGWVMIFDARQSAIRRDAGAAADTADTAGTGDMGDPRDRRDGALAKPKLATDAMVTRILVSGDRFDLRSGTVLPRR